MILVLIVETSDIVKEVKDANKLGKIKRGELATGKNGINAFMFKNE